MKDPLLRKHQSPAPSEPVDRSNQLQARSQGVRLPLLVLASTFPKSSGDSTPAFVLELSKHLQSRLEVTLSTLAVRSAADWDEIEGVQVRRFRYFWPRSLELLADGAILENLRRRRAEVSPLLHLAPHLDTVR